MGACAALAPRPSTSSQLPKRDSAADMLDAARRGLPSLAAAGGGGSPGFGGGWRDGRFRRALLQVLLLTSTLVLLSETRNGLRNQPHSLVPPFSGLRLTMSTDDPFLFIGILSGGAPKLRKRREAVRDAWSDKARQMPGVALRFFLCQEERTAEIEAEQWQHGDLAFAPCGGGQTGYRDLHFKVLHVFVHAVDTYPGVRFILKTDDDSFVNVRALLITLRALCLDPDCRNERMYMGELRANSSVYLKAGHKWENQQYLQHTGLSVYPRFANGGGYVLSGDVAAGLVAAHRAGPGLAFTPVEDANMGMWLLAFNLRHVDMSSRMRALAHRCCFVDPPGSGSSGAGGAALAPAPGPDGEQPEQQEQALAGSGAPAGKQADEQQTDEQQQQLQGGLDPEQQQAAANSEAPPPPPPPSPPLQMHRWIENQLCGPHAFFLLRKLDDPARMRFVAQRVASCPPLSTSEALAAVASSLAEEGEEAAGESDAAGQDAVGS